ncbi:hypothetical protein BDV98DRAFT_574001 [Pterulicium gracile]|uniref:Uncharacterized protein n=1 Tax=Pterulicium gracile TaxID=1884261 RepID=A0A5C3Q6F7_9AGAR|nr:hypothetical protein BDV98DRAFT_574001 [Pterula gracilis]
MRQVRYRLSRQLPQVRLLKQCLPPLMCTDYRILHCRQQRCIVPDISIHNDWAPDESLGGGLTASTFALAHLGGVIAYVEYVSRGQQGGLHGRAVRCDFGMASGVWPWSARFSKRSLCSSYFGDICLFLVSSCK